MSYFILKKKTQAFSLIELLMALAIMGIVLLPVFSIMGKSRRNAQEALDKMIANNILQSIEANLFNRPYLWLKNNLVKKGTIKKKISFDPETEFDPNSLLIKKSNESKKVSHQIFNLTIHAQEFDKFILVEIEISWKKGKKKLKIGKIISEVE